MQEKKLKFSGLYMLDFVANKKLAELFVFGDGANNLPWKRMRHKLLFTWDDFLIYCYVSISLSYVGFSTTIILFNKCLVFDNFDCVYSSSFIEMEFL